MQKLFRIKNKIGVMSVEFIVFEADQLTLITMNKYQPALINVATQCPVGDNKAND